MALDYTVLRPFDAWFDGGVKYAKLAVKVWIESERFTKSDYPSKQEWTQYVTSRVDIADSDLSFNKILNVLAKKFAVGKENSYFNLQTLLTRDDIVPFLTASGAFGINTYLYLLSHGLYAVSGSENPVQVHHSIAGAYNVLEHDLRHTSSVLNYGVKIDFDVIRKLSKAELISYFDNVVNPETALQRKVFPQLYNEIVSSTEFTEDQKKAQIYALFIGIHEKNSPCICVPEDCGKMELELRYFANAGDTWLKLLAWRIESYETTSFARVDRDVFNDGVNLYYPLFLKLRC